MAARVQCNRVGLEGLAVAAKGQSPINRPVVLILQDDFEADCLAALRVAWGKELRHGDVGDALWLRWHHRVNLETRRADGRQQAFHAP
jgi:hypothetical protein